MADLTNVNTTRLLIFSAFCSFLVGIDALIVSPLIPAMAQSEQFSAEIGGLLVTAYALPYGLSAPIFGPLSDRFGRRGMMVAGMLLFSLGTMCTAIGGGLAALLVYRAIAGIGGAMVMPGIYALIGDAFPYEKRGKAMAAVTGAMGASTLLGIPLGSFLAEYVSWQATFLAVGGVSLAAALLAYRIIPGRVGNPNVGTESKPFRFTAPFRKAFAEPAALYALLCTFLWWAGFQGLFANMGSFYGAKFALPTDVIGLVFSLAGLANLIGNIVGGKLSDRIGRKPVIYGACFASGATILALPLLDFSLWPVIVTHAVWAFATGVGQSTLTAFMSELNPGARGTILAMSSSATYLGMTASTSLAVLLLSAGGYVLVGILCSILVLSVVPILWYQVHEAGSRTAADKATTAR